MHLIDTTEKLSEACEALRRQDFVAIDTEFMR
jgi:ribonuclease D